MPRHVTADPPPETKRQLVARWARKSAARSRQWRQRRERRFAIDGALVDALLQLQEERHVLSTITGAPRELHDIALKGKKVLVERGMKASEADAATRGWRLYQELGCVEETLGPAFFAPSDVRARG
ncbi:hypothetical protein LNAOJCKE_4650 [Methylorubrum aminovorans]|uniref:Uncharacterized protein n=1 Tax=Methylorubrum aminovorans TaxID=269069 RepID=A0ABQ4UJJ1_9HYPH|nr:hypothetical protein LNAOJCKE_4650 [Methylorubrum aminovorans]GMA74804.1 hypothetical protein GCM10025880_12210 [Methylorubrum aminovorans]